MKLNIKSVDVQSNTKENKTSLQLLQAGCCCGGGSEIRPLKKK
ncbi:hypothetical protein [Lysinibacillus sp. NPDC092081]